MKLRVVLLALLVTALISGCTGTSQLHVENPNALYDETVQPSEGQPPFPKIGLYWVVDPGNKCHFTHETVLMAEQVFEALRHEGIAEVAVVCQADIKNKGPLNDEKIWAMQWGRFARLGDKHDQRAIVWLIRPDVPPEQNRVTIEVSYWLTWYTAVDYGPGLEEAAMYANAGDFDGALESIVRTTNETLRLLWREHQSVR